jgi:deazaflavin-dependent oxidoreductase (nitroreductase family)
VAARVDEVCRRGPSLLPPAVRSCEARGVNPFFKLFVKGHVWLYQATGGRRGATLGGQKILLLTTKGRKSGQQRTVPVVPYLDGDDVYVIASLGGAPQHPAWFHNLSAHAEVGVQLGADHWRAHAEVVPEGPDRDRLWKAITELMPNFAGYQKKTTRVIPVVKLVREPA